MDSKIYIITTWANVLMCDPCVVHAAAALVTPKNENFYKY